MLKRNIGYPILYFVCFSVYQLIFNDTVEWINNLLLSVFVYLFYVFFEWANIPYDWSKKRKKNSVDS